MTWRGFAAWLLGVTAPAIAHPIVIDGWFEDWDGSRDTVVDPIGDGAGPFDITSVTLQTSGARVYVRFRLAEPCGLQNGEPAEAGLRMRVETAGQRGAAKSGFMIDFRGRSVTSTTGSGDASTPIAGDAVVGDAVAWSRLRYTCLPTYASDEYELGFDAGALGIDPGDSVSVNFEGSDELARPAKTRLLGTAVAAPDASADWTTPSGDLRISCWNTMFSGLGDAERAGAFDRLLSAMRSDVYCFVEETDEAGFRDAMRRLSPRGGRLNAVWRNGRALAARHAVEPITESGLDEQCVAVVGDRLVLIVTHLECCGYAGSEQDETRVAQAQRIAEFVTRLRSGKLGARLRAMPVVVVGDFNLVGSREPLAVLERSAGLTEARLLATHGRHAATWRSLEPGSYAPGRLDLLTYDASRLRRVGGGVIDTEEMGPRLLEALGLRPTDSRASDHLMLYADFNLMGSAVTPGSSRLLAKERPTGVGATPAIARRP